VRGNLEGQGVERREIDVRYSVDLRYAGQFHSLTVPLTATTREAFDESRVAFDREHHRQYRYSHPEWDVELAVIRATAHGRREITDVSYSRRAQATGLARYARSVRFPGASSPLECDVIDRQSIAPGDRLEGPLIVEQADSTTIIPAGASATCADRGELVIATGEARP
jgi:N-methylhydantoinase A